MLIDVQQQLHFINSSLGRRCSLTQLIDNCPFSITFKSRLILWLPDISEESRVNKAQKSLPFLITDRTPNSRPSLAGSASRQGTHYAFTPPGKLEGPDVTTKYGQSNTAKTAQHKHLRWALINRSLLEAIYSGFEPEWTVAVFTGERTIVTFVKGILSYVEVTAHS
jgi:hypothetical protein